MNDIYREIAEAEAEVRLLSLRLKALELQGILDQQLNPAPEISSVIPFPDPKPTRH